MLWKLFLHQRIDFFFLLVLATVTFKMNACCCTVPKNGGFSRRFSTPSVQTQCCVSARGFPGSSRRSSLDCGHAVRRQLSLVEFPTHAPSADRWRLQVPGDASSSRDGSDASTEIDTSELSAVSSEAACRTAKLVSGSYQLLPDVSTADRPSVWKYIVSPRPAWRGLLLGQVVSLLAAVCGGVDSRCEYTRAHTAFGFFGFKIVAQYVLLCLVYMAWAVVHPRRTGIVAAMRHRCWCYLLLALTDVEARYLSAMSAYYTSVHSVQLLGSAAVPAAMVISCRALDVHYRPAHLFGAALCFAGLACSAWANFQQLGGSDNARGIVLGLAGAVLRSAVVVSEEYAVKVWHWAELLGALGLFGTIFAALQVWLFVGLPRAEDGLPVAVAQVAALAALQSLSLAVLGDGGAAALLLSLFTAGVYLPVASLLLCRLLHSAGDQPVQVLYEFKCSS
ncbi:solute carrier family 35 member F2-like isoform X2 [Bacillus rossius redtenbacheri]|uniref:solute carrier family 35 member F2-like isoform X2 n=1 Tax=Bacillus rossius redtenbacheri TaxID=93214 RepID=UPI002FDE2E66